MSLLKIYTCFSFILSQITVRGYTHCRHLKPYVPFSHT